MLRVNINEEIRVDGKQCVVVVLFLLFLLFVFLVRRTAMAASFRVLQRALLRTAFLLVACQVRGAVRNPQRECVGRGTYNSSHTYTLLLATMLVGRFVGRK